MPSCAAKKASRTTTLQWPDAKAIREKLGLSQTQFATLIGISPRTLQNFSVFAFGGEDALKGWTTYKNFYDRHRSTARRMPAALWRVSSYSCSGSESATMPAPT